MKYTRFSAHAQCTTTAILTTKTTAHGITIENTTETNTRGINVGIRKLTNDTAAQAFRFFEKNEQITLVKIENTDILLDQIGTKRQETLVFRLSHPMGFCCFSYH